MVGFIMAFQRGGPLRAGVELILSVDPIDPVNEPEPEPVPGFFAGSCKGSTRVITP
jgi:hypothetical protein